MEDTFFSKSRWNILAFFAAFPDALLGGGWGLTPTPILILANEGEPRKVIGSVAASVFFVTAAETFTFIWLLGVEQFRWEWILALVTGGGISAPLAAHTSKRVHPRL